MISPRICILQLPALEQHDRNIDSTIARGCYSSAHAVEIILVKAGQVELGLPVPRHARSTPRPRVGLAVFDSSSWLILAPLRGFPSPQPEKVMIPFLHEIQVAVVIKDRRWILIDGVENPCPVVLKVPPGMRACQVNSLACAIGKVTRIAAQDAKRPLSRI